VWAIPLGAAAAKKRGGKTQLVPDKVQGRCLSDGDSGNGAFCYVGRGTGRERGKKGFYSGTNPNRPWDLEHLTNRRVKTGAQRSGRNLDFVDSGRGGKATTQGENEGKLMWGTSPRKTT